MLIILYSFYLLYALDCTEFLDECFQSSVVVNHDFKVATEQTIMGINVDAAQYELFFFGNDTRQICDNADVVDTDDP